jgi:hypothetical protein
VFFDFIELKKCVRVLLLKDLPLPTFRRLHDYRGRAAENTFQISLHADGSVGMHQPNSFTSIVQKVDEGVVITE